jgi:hypothetical protein
MSRITPAWFLFLFAPVTAEYLSGSSPALNPIVLVANMILYGCGVLLIRELKVRWQRGWLAVLILSIAYTIAEEGLMLNTLFDPIKNTTGRFAGVNWVWLAGMLVVHSLLSVVLPILMAETVFAAEAAKPWIKPRTFWLALAFFAADVFGLGRAFAPINRPGWVYYAVELGIIAACLISARFLPAMKPESDGPSRSARWYYFAFLIGTLATITAGVIAPVLPLPAWVQISLMFAVYIGFLCYARRNHGFSPTLPPMSRLACAAGIISFWILACPLSVMFRGSGGPPVVAVLMTIFLLSLRKRLAGDCLKGFAH